MRAPGLAGWTWPLRTGPVARRTCAARAVAPPDVPPVVPSPAGAATGAEPPWGVAVAGVAGGGGASAARDALVVRLVKTATVSKRPKRVRSCGPVTFVVPFGPTRCARTTRGETPRWTTLMRLNLPCTRPRSFACTCAGVSVIGFQRWRGAKLSYGSSTPFSHGSAPQPTNEFSMFSVLPPEVEKKYVVTGTPL